MRTLVIADIHANLTAFQAVIEDAKRRGGFDCIWCLGDIVGYGPDPHECLELLRQFQHSCVAGNHDLAAAGILETDSFNHTAAKVIDWTSQQLTDDDIAYLKSLPLQIQRDDFTLVHGSPRDPVWEYIVSYDEAIPNFLQFKTPYCLVGHSHIPLAFEQIADSVCFGYRILQQRIILGVSRLIVNPGGLGQPRDGDPRAAYAIYDEHAHSIDFYRTSYDIAATQAKMRAKKLPTTLIERLANGW